MPDVDYNMSKDMQKESTIMFTDMVGYSKLVNTDEVKALSLLEEFNKINFSNIKKYNGKVIKLIGDAVFAEFDSAKHAVYASIDMQKDIRKRNKLSKKIDYFNMRIGLHKGNVIIKDNDLFGHTVNLGSRIEGIAPIGGIAISKNTFSDIKEKNDIHSRKIGAIKLKNIKYPQIIYKIYLDTKDYHSETHHELVASLKARDILLVDDKNYKRKTTHPIALLYLDNLGKETDDFFTYSTTESIIADLKKIETIRIPSIANVQTFSKRNLPDSEIGRRLKVDKIIKGNLIRTGNVCQVSLEMIDLIEGESVWNHTWKGNSNYTNVLNGEMITGILETLDLDIPEHINQYFTYNKTENAEAYDNYLKGQKIKNFSSKPDDFEKAASFYKKAIEIDSGFVEAYVELATTYQWTYRYEEAEDILRDAEILAKETHNNPGLATVYSHFGIIYQNWSKYERSLIYLEKSLEIQSNLNNRFEEAKVYHNIGNFYSYNTPKQNIKKAKSYLDKAVDIYKDFEEDHAIASGFATIGNLYKNSLKFSESINYHEDALAKFTSLNMTFYEYRVKCVLADTFIKLGMYRHADKYIDDTISIAEEFDDYYILGRMFYISGQINLNNKKISDAIDDLEESVENYQLAEKNDYSTEVMLELVRINLQQDNKQKAKRYLKKATRLIKKQKDTTHNIYLELEQKIMEQFLLIKNDNTNISSLDKLFKKLNKDIQLENGYTQLWYLACCYEGIGEHKKAHNLVKKCITTIKRISEKISNSEQRKYYLESNLLHKKITNFK